MPEAAAQQSPGSGDVHILTHEFMPFRGGIGVYVEETAAALSMTGRPTTVWAPDYGKPETGQTPYRIRRVPMRGRQDWLCRIQLAKALQRAFPDGRIPGTVILAEPGPVRLWMYQRFLRLPRPARLIVILHGTEICQLASVAHRKLLLGRLLCEADRVGAVSRAVREMILSNFPGLADKMVSVPGAVRQQWHDLPPASGRGEHPPRHILQVGRISPRKGQHILLEAIAKLPEDLKNGLKVTLAGPAGKEAYCRRVRQMAGRHHLPVDFTGGIHDSVLRDLYARADLVVMPSQPYRKSVEGLGIALLEGAHFGCPVVGSRLGGIPETLVENETGLLVPPGDPAALATALEQLIRDPQAAARMGMAGSAFVRRRFSWRENAARLVQDYAE